MEEKIVGLVRLEQEVLKQWKSIRRLYTFLEKEFQRVNRECFNDRLPLPSFHLKRMRFSRDIFGGGYIGATYRPPGIEEKAQIGFFPIVLLNKDDTLTALAHEMVHHWEWIQRERGGHCFLQPEVENMILRQFPDSDQHYGWRLGHSFQFIAKASEVAQTLKLPLKEFLFKKVPEILK